MTGRSRQPGIEPPYRSELTGVLEFRGLAETEQTLRRLDELRGRYVSQNDRNGIEACRSLALLGRRRAESLARNPRVHEAKRREKREIAEWFRIWLETPDLFWDWLALRKSSEAFSILREAVENCAGRRWS
jgi:hypothetical protein